MAREYLSYLREFTSEDKPLSPMNWYWKQGNSGEGASFTLDVIALSEIPKEVKGISKEVIDFVIFDLDDPLNALLDGFPNETKSLFDQVSNYVEPESNNTKILKR